ncbi:hypothetical protein [Isoptericola sp. BMS4]|uniref:hypothetical protein n=1 Tax=Isoptericola sp. BMS4 TaxID=2527875 RepID=UPI00141E0015|nr:hypothetical protein [Isoptericola sp. BMS4]
MSPSTVLADLRLSLPDIAELAGVKRPVVSTWRRRHAVGPHPFPAAVTAHGGSPRFRATDVVDWVEATGLGNNRSFRADVAMRATLDEDDPARARRLREGLEALLCLREPAGEPLAGLSRGEVEDLADEVDPDDAALYAEVVALGDDLGRVGELADLAADAAYTPGAAFEALLADRFRAGRRDLTMSALAPAALDLVARVAAEIGGDVAVADPWPGYGDLLHAALAVERLDAPAAHLPAGHRLARRRLTVHGRQLADLFDDAGTPALDPHALVVTQVPSAGTPELDDVEVLERLDRLVLGLHLDQRAVVIGPASALADRPADARAESLRAALLRTDRLRAVVVLPPGLVPERARQRLAVWVLGDAPAGVPIPERWTMVADLSDRQFGARFEDAVVEDLLTDVTASLAGRDAVVAHSFRFAKFTLVSDVLARGGGLLASGRPLEQGVWDDGGAAAVRVAELTASLDGVTRPPLGVRVERGDAVPVRRAPLGALAEAGLVRLIPGNRVDRSDVVAAGDRDPSLTRVVGVPELVGERPWGSRGVATLRFAENYPAGRLTEPGDVIVTTTPVPAAVVDDAGFSVVEYPARVLRVTARGRSGAGGSGGRSDAVVPEVLARDVAAQPAGAKWWRSWEVRLVPAEQADAVGQALRAVDARAAAARRELADLDTLAVVLCDGATGGVVHVRFNEATP